MKLKFKCEETADHANGVGSAKLSMATEPRKPGEPAPPMGQIVIQRVPGLGLVAGKHYEVEFIPA